MNKSLDLQKSVDLLESDGPRDVVMLSFAWIAADYLARIKIRSGGSDNVDSAKPINSLKRYLIDRIWPALEALRALLLCCSYIIAARPLYQSKDKLYVSVVKVFTLLWALDDISFWIVTCCSNMFLACNQALRNFSVFWPYKILLVMQNRILYCGIAYELWYKRHKVSCHRIVNYALFWLLDGQIHFEVWDDHV